MYRPTNYNNRFIQYWTDKRTTEFKVNMQYYKRRVLVVSWKFDNNAVNMLHTIIKNYNNKALWLTSFTIRITQNGTKC